MSGALVVYHEIPAGQVVAIAEDVVAEIDALVDSIMTRGQITPHNLSAADYDLRKATTLRTRIEAQRKQVKAPILDLGRQVDHAANGQIDRLVAVEREQARTVDEYNRAAEAANREAERRRHEQEAAERAAAERKAREEQEAIERMRVAASTPADKLAADQLAAESVQREIQAVTAPTAIAPAAPLPVSDAVRKTPRRVVKVHDLAALCATGGTVNGVQVVDALLPSIRKLLLANVPVPGCELVDEVSIGGKGFGR